MTPQAFDLIALARSAGSSLPLFALQAAAALGLLASTLLLSQQRSLSVERRGLHVGFGLGLASFIIAWFVSEHMKGPVKLNLSIDLVLLAGLIGGWRGGLVCLGLSQLARLNFSGTGYFLASTVDQGAVLLAGWWAHAHFHAALRERFSLRSVVAVWGARVLATYVGLALAQAIVHAPAELVWQWAGLRALVLPLSLAVLIVAALLMRLDAQIDQQRLREHELTHKDQLTGLPNRKSLSEFVEAFWRVDARREGCLAVIELANLRDFLLRYGPEYGGLLWAQMGDVERAHSILRPLAKYRVHAFQYGDFSLAVFVEGARMERLEKSGEVERFLRHLSVELAAQWPSFAPVFRCAVVDWRDGAEGRGRSVPYRNITLALTSVDHGVAYFNQLVKHDAALDEYINESLDEWARAGTAPMHYQPKISLADQSVVGAEALLRMSDPEGKPISAMRAISVFRRQGRLVEFEAASVRAVIQVLGRARAARGDITVAVNVSADSLRSEGFGPRVCELLAAAQVPGRALCIEIVEWSEIVQMADIQANVEALHRAGVGFSLDDFGVGYSSLGLLTQMSFTEVKLDQSLVAALESGKSQVIVELAIDIAHRGGATVVAEGLETEAAAARVRQLGVDVGQGYLFSRAVRFDDFLAFRNRPVAAARQALSAPVNAPA